jgi:hypothetical protein
LIISGLISVMPAQAGIQVGGGGYAPVWIPAFAGMTTAPGFGW